MQRMLCDHGVFPHEVMRLSVRERVLRSELLMKESRELEKLK